MGDRRAIVFDLGNVVFDISFDRMYRYWAERNGIGADELKERLVFDETYRRFERGELTPDAYRDYAIGKLGLGMDYAEFDRGWNNIYLNALPGMPNLIQVLESRHRLGALTNTNAIHAERWRERYATILQHFDRILCSFELGARKPEREIYVCMLERLNTGPENILFFDDKPENVEGAKECGIRAFQANSCAQIVLLLEESGIEMRGFQPPEARKREGTENGRYCI